MKRAYYKRYYLLNRDLSKVKKKSGKSLIGYSHSFNFLNLRVCWKIRKLALLHFLPTTLSLPSNFCLLYGYQEKKKENLLEQYPVFNLSLFYKPLQRRRKKDEVSPEYIRSWQTCTKENRGSEGIETTYRLLWNALFFSVRFY